MNIIITGGTRGIGKSVTQLFAADKFNRIIVTGRKEDALESLANSTEFNNIITFKLDLAQLATEAIKFKQFILSQFDSVDIIINNAGYLISRRFSETSDSETRAIMDVNFFAPATIIRTLLPLMKPGSHIINIGSMGGFQGSSKYKGLAIYSASKAAIACLTECLAEEFNDIGVKINCLALGSVQTEMLSEAFPGYKAPIKAEEMAEFIKEFALNGNKYFNGKILPVALNNP